jgi:hypothetical protein
VSNEYKATKVNVISSPDGELQIRRVGLSITFRGQSYEVDSEMLHPPMSIAVYWQRRPASRARNADDIRRFINEGLAEDSPWNSSRDSSRRTLERLISRARLPTPPQRDPLRGRSRLLFCPAKSSFGAG